MKKQLLIGTALFIAVSAFPQQGIKKAKPVGLTNMAEKLSRKYAAINNPHESVVAGKQIAAPENNTLSNPVTEAAATAVPSASWQAIGGSMNIYGVLSSQSKPLNFNDNLNAVSFVHRKGGSYVAAPADNSGAQVARITTNWGATWDSTCYWSNNTNLARYPQGGIYNPQGNTNISNAYIVGMGPVTDGTSWVGNWYGSKQLGPGNYNNMASATPGAQQYIPNTAPFAPGLAKHDFPRVSFSSTDDGKVRTLGNRYYGYDNGAGAPIDFRGAAIIKGSFNAGVFTWTSDTIIPNAITRTNGTKQMWDQPIMAWNESGTTGYVIFIGAAATATGSNKGWQPIVYKTSNSGASWASIPGIDFNDPSMAAVKAPIQTPNASTVEVPFFKIDEGYDATVDISGKLHIISTVVGSASTHNDSLEYTYQFGVEKYSWNHTPGQRPYLYDFVSDGSGPWALYTIDSLATEGAGASTSAPGYTDNPWDADPSNANEKVTSDSRCQIGRTPDGQFIIFSWAESDTAFTNGQKKWNTLPNIKARAMIAGGTPTLSTTEVNVTKPTPAVPGFTSNSNVSNRAMFHYQSATALYQTCIGTAGASSVQIKVPFTVSNSNPYSQLTENKHWYSTTTLDFLGLTICTGFNQSLAYNVGSVEVYPNPANSNATVAIDLKEEGNVVVNIYNTIGQLVQTANTSGKLGMNKLEINVDGLSKGIYMVNVKVGNTVSTKKLLVD